MEDQEDPQQSQTLRPLVERDRIPASRFIHYQAFIELLDLRFMVIESLRHPVEAVKAYIPHLDIFGLLGGKVFPPEVDVPDLAGKVILVTGGELVPYSPKGRIIMFLCRKHRARPGKYPPARSLQPLAYLPRSPHPSKSRSSYFRPQKSLSFS